MRLRLPVITLAPMLLLLASTGCATKKYVSEEVGAVDQRVDGVEGQVEDAQTKLREHDTRINTASKTANEALERAIAAGKLAEGKFIFESVLTDENVRFGFDQAEISKSGEAALAQFAEHLKNENKAFYIEIQGHTDSVGSEEYNMKLGETRAEGVRLYLNREHDVPLHRVSVISYGETAPVADNDSREGRAKNRRVALVVLK